MKFFKNIEEFKCQEFSEQARIVLQNYVELNAETLKLGALLDGKKILADIEDKLCGVREIVLDLKSSSLGTNNALNTLSLIYSALSLVHKMIKDINKNPAVWRLSDDVEPKRTQSCPVIIEERSFEEKHAIVNPHLKFEI